MTATLMLPDVRLAHYRLSLEVREELHLPRYMGSTLRGGSITPDLRARLHGSW